MIPGAAATAHGHDMDRLAMRVRMAVRTVALSLLLLPTGLPQPSPPSVDL